MSLKLVKDIVTLLLEGGADPNMASDNGVTAMHMAARFGHASIVLLMLQVRTQAVTLRRRL